MAIVVAGLHRYVVKSCHAESLEIAQLDARGVVDDRRFMAVGDDGSFLNQRQVPALALIAARLDGHRLTLSTAGRQDVTVDLAAPRPRRAVAIWAYRDQGEDCGDAVAAWLSSVLGRAARLVRMPDDAVRPVDPEFAAAPTDQFGYMDSHPLLLMNRTSLGELNKRLAAPILMDRFRPNMVIDGAEPFAEDTWKRIRVGAVEFAVVKPCARCVIITIDQSTAERTPEPFKTLAAFRTKDKKVLFGQYLVHRGLGAGRVGDAVTVLE